MEPTDPPGDDDGDELRAAGSAAQLRRGTYIDPSSNWFTANVKRFGAGFDMKQLTSQPGLLASKFDKLSDKYDQWTVGNRCSYYHWLARASHAASAGLRAPEATIVDVACGIGLPGHTLRLCGLQGRLVGTDISPGMLEQARGRRVYDELVLANANKGMPIESASADLVVCVVGRAFRRAPREPVSSL